MLWKKEKGSARVFVLSIFAAELLPRGLPFLLCYAFALDSAVQEEIVALATLFE